MAVGTNRWKLGLFVLLGMGLALAAIVLLGARNFNEKTVTYLTFFDESVQGLDAGSPVKFRGVTIGRVATIDVAPDHRDTFAYPDQALISAVRYVSVDPGVGDRQLQVVFAVCHRYLGCRARAAVLEDIGEGFLDDPISREIHSGRIQVVRSERPCVYVRHATAQPNE